jgi:hypothetical protein
MEGNGPNDELEENVGRRNWVLRYWDFGGVKNFLKIFLKPWGKIFLI